MTKRRIKVVKNVAANIETKSVRSDMERKLGKKMHEISIQQGICVKENKKLKDLQDEANKLDEELSKFDGE